jgi:hypothetical protein
MWKPSPPRTGDGGLPDAGPVGSGGPAPRSRHPLHDPAVVPESGGGGHGQPGLTREGTGAGGCGLQVPEVLTGVCLDGVRDVVAVRDPAEKVEQFSARRRERLAGVVVGHVHIVTDGAADRHTGCRRGAAALSLHVVGDDPEDLGGDLVALASNTYATGSTTASSRTRYPAASCAARMRSDSSMGRTAASLRTMSVSTRRPAAARFWERL